MFFKKKSKKAKRQIAPIVKVATNRLYVEDLPYGFDSQEGCSSQYELGCYLDSCGLPVQVYENVVSDPYRTDQWNDVRAQTPPPPTTSEFFAAIFTPPNEPVARNQLSRQLGTSSLPKVSARLAHPSLAMPQISPAKNTELIEAEKRLKEYFAARKVNIPVIAAVECPLESANPHLTGSKFDFDQSAEISPAKGAEIEEARKRMETFLADKENLKIVAPSKMKINPKVDIYIKSGNQISPAKGNELIEAERKMAAFLAKKKEETGSTELQLSNPVDTKRLQEASISNTECSIVAEKSTVAQKVVINVSNQISPAKDDEIAEAQRRMDAFLAEKKKSSITAETKNAAPQMDSAMKDQVAEADNKPAECVADKKITNNQESAVDTFNQLSPAKADEIAEAQKRMEAFLAGKKLTVPTGPSLPVSAHQTPTLISSVKVEELAGSEQQLKEVKLPEKSEVTEKPVINASAQISPAKEDEIAEAQKRMEAFLSAKQAKSSLATELPTLSTAPTLIAEKIEVSTIASQLSPAKPDEIAEAQKRMDAFLAGKPGIPKKQEILVSQSVESTSEVTQPQINTQLSPAKEDELIEAELKMKKFLETKNQSIGVKLSDKPAKFTLNKPNLAEAMRTPTKNSLSEDTENDSVVASNEEKIVVIRKKLNTTPAKDEEVREAVKAMESILTNLNTPKILSQVPEMTQVSPAKGDELVEAERRMKEFLAKKKDQCVKKLLVEPVVSRVSTEPCCSNSYFTIESETTPKANYLSPTAFSDSSVDTVLAVTPLARPTILAPGIHGPEHGTPDKFTFSESDQRDYAIEQLMQSPGFGTPQGSATRRPISTPTKFCSPDADSSRDTSAAFSPIREESPVVVKRTVYLEVLDPVQEEELRRLARPAESCWLEAQMAMLFGRFLPIQPQPVIVAPQPVVPVQPVVDPIFSPLSEPVCSKGVKEVLKKLEEEQKKAQIAKLNSHTTIASPERLKPCISKPDMLEKVPDHLPHPKTPCQTPLKMKFDKKLRPGRYEGYTKVEILRKRIAELVRPKCIKRNISFGATPNKDQPMSFDDFVNDGVTGFRILSVVDHETNTIRFPKFKPPSDQQ